MSDPSSRQSQNELYTYSLAWPLASWQTRLIKLLPDLPESELECELHVGDIIANPGMGLSGQRRVQEYEALSYSWGKPERTAKVRCNARQASIPPGLFEALQGLRLRDQPRWLWCDALCINQDDPKEKSAQIQNMLHIFQKASRVVAWLGEMQDDTQHAFTVMNRFSTGEYKTLRHFQDESRSCAEMDKRKMAIEALVKVRWFRRTWVRQEVWANKNLILKSGSNEAPFASFFSLIQHMHVPLYVRHIANDHSRASRTDLTYPEDSPQTSYCLELCRLLHSGRAFEVSDDRDRVYALLGISQNWTYAEQNSTSIIAPIVPDYTKDLNQVYQAFVKYCINIERSLACLGTFEARSVSDDLASWAVDWRQKPKTESDPWREAHYYRSAIEYEFPPLADMQSLDNLGELVLTGVLLGIARSDDSKS